MPKNRKMTYSDHQAQATRQKKQSGKPTSARKTTNESSHPAPPADRPATRKN